jgi:hypothetical protein
LPTQQQQKQGVAAPQPGLLPGRNQGPAGPSQGAPLLLKKAVPQSAGRQWGHTGSGSEGQSSGTQGKALPQPPPQGMAISQPQAKHPTQGPPHQVAPNTGCDRKKGQCQ